MLSFAARCACVLSLEKGTYYGCMWSILMAVNYPHKICEP